MVEDCTAELMLFRRPTDHELLVGRAMFDAFINFVQFWLDPPDTFIQLYRYFVTINI